MPKPTPQVVTEQLKRYRVPHLECDLVSAKAIKNITIEDQVVTLIVELGYPVAPVRAELVAALQKLILALPGIARVVVNVTTKIVAHAVRVGVPAVSGVKNIIAVASGKGGVGKSTTAVNVALALAAAGARVGLLDADIYGPNQPLMLGVAQKPEIQDNKKIVPIMEHGIQSMSLGYLSGPQTPMIWRGPMVSKALQQLVRATLWHDLDYLFVDLPPGTGDIQLTLVQKVPVSAAIIVTTPQDVALLDARKGLQMFNKVNVPVLGIVENMATHVCTQCGHEEAIFGVGGGERMARECQVTLLGQLPLAKRIRADADRGQPTVIAEPHGELAARYHVVALRLAAALSLQPVNYAAKFPPIVVERQ